MADTDKVDKKIVYGFLDEISKKYNLCIGKLINMLNEEITNQKTQEEQLVKILKNIHWQEFYNWCTNIGNGLNIPMLRMLKGIALESSIADYSNDMLVYTGCEMNGCDFIIPSLNNLKLEMKYTIDCLFNKKNIRPFTKPITLLNSKGTNTHINIPDTYADYLMIVESKGCAVISKEKLKQYVISNGDSLSAKIPTKELIIISTPENIKEEVIPQDLNFLEFILKSLKEMRISMKNNMSNNSKKATNIQKVVNNTESKVESKVEESKMENLTKMQLLTKCEELGITKCKSKNKGELIDLIEKKNNEVKPQVKKIQKKINTRKSSFNFIDLFCGIGGFHQALKKLNGNCVFACDIDKSCCKIYEQNYGLKPEEDINDVVISDIPSFDVLCAGFPCQPFSKAGFQKGFKDDRGNLFFKICEIIEHHKPKYLLLENVRNLSSHDNGNTWKIIHEKILELGYNTYTNPTILNVLHFNIPQNRERVVIMCKRKDLGELPKLPLICKNPKLSLTQTIKDIVIDDEKYNKKYKIEGKKKEVEIVWNNFIDILSKNDVDIPKFPIWTDWWDNDFDEKDKFYVKYTDWIDKNRLFYEENREILENWLIESRKNKNWFGAVRKFEWQAGDSSNNINLNHCLWSLRGSGIRVKKCDYIPTLVAMSMIPIYGPESRTLSPKELLKLQSFPAEFEYDEKTIYKQLGNAVNVKMIEKCARFLMLNENLF